MKNMKLLFGILSVLVILFTTGCQDMDNASDQQGHLVIKLTDAPFPIDMIEAATVYINKVEIRKKSEGEELGYPYITLLEELEEPLEFNLLDLRNGITADLVDMEIDPGNYDLIRLYVDVASLSVKEGETYNLKVPSGSQTGIKMFIKPNGMILTKTQKPRRPNLLLVLSERGPINGSLIESQIANMMNAVVIYDI